MDSRAISPMGRLRLFSCLRINIGVRRVVLYEIAPWLNVVAHEHGEYLIRLGGVFYRHLFEQPIGRIHRRFPKLLRIHLSQTFVSLCVDAFRVLVSVGILVEKRLALCLVIAIFACLALISTLVKWRGRYVKVSLLDNLRHTCRKTPGAVPRYSNIRLSCPYKYTCKVAGSLCKGVPPR